MKKDKLNFVMGFMFGIIGNMLVEWHFRTVDNPDVNNIFHFILTIVLVIIMSYVYVKRG